MRKSSFAIAVVLSLILIGCSSASKQLVGTWKGEIAPVPGQKNSLEDAFKGLLNAFVGPMTIEFNQDGKYKVSLSLGSETGTYSVSGDEVTFKPDTEDPNAKNHMKLGVMVLSPDGKTLHSKKEFKSDSVIELKKHG